MKDTKRELTFKAWRALSKILLIFGEEHDFNQVDYLTVLSFMVDGFLGSMAEADKNRSYEEYVKMFTESLMLLNNHSNPEKKES